MTWGVPLLVSYHIAFSYCSWGSQDKNTEVACHSLLQWTTALSNSMKPSHACGATQDRRVMVERSDRACPLEKGMASHFSILAFSYCSWVSQGKNTVVVCHSLLQWTTFCQNRLWNRNVAHSCPTLCDPMDCSLSGSSVHGIFQARVLEWVAISFSNA